MELEREPRKPTPHRAHKPLTGEPIRAQTPAKFEHVTYAREACYSLGLILLTVGLVGFVVDNLLGTHLSYAHNLIHVVSGLGAILCAYLGRGTAKKFALGFGALYGALGILGFIFGVAADPSVGHGARDASLWVLSPEVLEFGTSDHILHLIFAAVFIGAALFSFRRRTDAGAIYH